jgi:hypothetical protein
MAQFLFFASTVSSIRAMSARRSIFSVASESRPVASGQAHPPVFHSASQLVLRNNFITSSISVMRPFFCTISVNSRARTGIGKRRG